MTMMHPDCMRNYKDAQPIIRPVTRYTGYTLVEVLREIKEAGFKNEKGEPIELCSAFEELVCRAMAGTPR